MDRPRAQRCLDTLGRWGEFTSYLVVSALIVGFVAYGAVYVWGHFAYYWPYYWVATSGDYFGRAGYLTWPDIGIRDTLAHAYPYGWAIGVACGVGMAYFCVRAFPHFDPRADARSYLAPIPSLSSQPNPEVAMKLTSVDSGVSRNDGEA